MNLADATANMTPAELNAASRKLVRKLVLTKIVIPAAVTAAVVVAVKLYEKKTADTQTEN